MSHLFSPIEVGSLSLSHRVVMAPLTRMRADAGDIPGEPMVAHYADRATRGGFIIAEATPVSIRGIGYAGQPGIYDDSQIAGWKKVTEAVHAKGAKIFLQLFHTGRQSHTSLQPNGDAPVAPSAVASEGDYALLTSGPVPVSTPRALELDEVRHVIEEFRKGAERAKLAGFDGVELHGANGYLVDQFLQDNSNLRTDIYGGSVENRARFLLEITRELIGVWGSKQVAVRIGPSGSFGGMADSHPAATFGYVAEQLNSLDLAYLHIIEPRIVGSVEKADGLEPIATRQLRKIYHGKIIAAGGFNGETAEALVAEGAADLVAFGRHFIANPDLPHRLQHGLALNAYDRDTFYYGGAKGYNDYPLHDEARAA
jgi:N-ethylmaleimide reductase